MLERLKELYRYRELLVMMAWRDVKVKYVQSLMGVLWALFMPILVVCAGMMVKYAISVVSGKPMEIQQLAAVSVKAVPWAFFIGSLRFGTNSLLGNQNLVTRIYFPKEIFPIAAVLSCLFDFGVAATVLGVALAVAGIGSSAQLLWVPALLAILIAFSLALSLLLSCLNLFYRDVKFIVEVILTFAIFFTPVLFEADTFGENVRRLLLLNPLSPLLEGFYATIVLHRSPDVPWVLYSATASLLLLLFSYQVFKRLEPRFAESI